MGLFNILDISAAGLSVERARLEVGVTNLANAQTTSPPGGTAYQPLEAIVRSGSPAQMNPQAVAGGALEDTLPRPFVAELTPMTTTPRRVYDPGHPDADAQGFVSYPGIDPVTSMMDLVSISRSYEANIKAFDITRSLLERTLENGVIEMSVAPIAALGANADIAPLWSTAPAAPEWLNAVPGTDNVFQPLLSALTQLNTDIAAGEKGLQSVALGDLDNLHQSMMGMEKVRLSLQLLLQVRSRALDAYQELMRMQV